MGETAYERIEQRIRATRDRLTEEGRLLSPEDLSREYDCFRARFGPDRLQALSGSDLLTVLATRGSADSLPDHLEEQGRDHHVFGELRPSGRLCVGLWFDQEIQFWCRFVRGREYVRGESPFVRLTTTEAIDLAEWWRSQLLAAADLISHLPEIAGDSDYAELDDALRTRAPDLHWPWAHKYLCMCFPDRLDQFHDSVWQRFMLIKCLEVPPRPEELHPSPYTFGGRFVRMARELGMCLNHLCSSLETLFGRPHSYWMLETTEGDWQEFISQGFIDLGWPVLGDLSIPSFPESLRWDDMVGERLRLHYPGAHPRRVLNQFQWLVRELHDRDVVVAHQGRRVLGMAEVTGRYYFQPTSALPHRRPIRRLDVDLPALPDSGGRSTLHPLCANGSLMLAVEEALLESE